MREEEGDYEQEDEKDVGGRFDDDSNDDATFAYIMPCWKPSWAIRGSKGTLLRNFGRTNPSGSPSPPSRPRRWGLGAG